MDIEITAPSNVVKPGSVVHLSAKATAGGAPLPGVSVAWSIPLLKVKDAVSTTDANGDAPFVVQAFSEGIASVTARATLPGYADTAATVQLAISTSSDGTGSPPTLLLIAAFLVVAGALGTYVYFNWLRRK